MDTPIIRTDKITHQKRELGAQIRVSFGVSVTQKQSFTSKHAISLTASLINKDSAMRVPGDSGVGDTESVSSLELGSTHSGSPGTPVQGGTPTFRRPSFLQQRERLYRAGSGKYVAVQDVESQQPGDLSLHRGMEIEGENKLYLSPLFHFSSSFFPSSLPASLPPFPLPPSSSLFSSPLFFD